MSRDPGGIFKYIYPAVLFALGAMAWTHYRAKAPADFDQMSLSFDNRLVEIFNAHGITGRSIREQTRQERALGKKSWIEYFRDIEVPLRETRDALVLDMRKAAEKESYSITIGSNAAGAAITVGKDGAVFSRTVLRGRDWKTGAFPARTRLAGRIALVIDDVGGSVKSLEPYFDQGIPVTFAVMPKERQSREIARMLSARKMPYILHLPLEPLSYPDIDPGPAALLVSMPKGSLRKKFMEDLESVPGVVGVSNHMGSRFTSDRERMETLMAMIGEKGLFFFDSHTSSMSVAGKVAKEKKVPHATNSYFLDLKDDPAFMERQWSVAMEHARRHGYCIVIGHAQKKNMLPVIRKIMPAARERGYEFVYLTDMIK